MKPLLVRLGAGLRSCWQMRGSSRPQGTYALLFLATWWFVGREWWSAGQVNVFDLFWAVVFSVLMVLAFQEGFQAPSTPPEVDS